MVNEQERYSRRPADEGPADEELEEEEFDRPRPKPKPFPWLLVLLVGCGGLFLIAVLLAALALPAVFNMRERVRRAQCATNLHQIGLALIFYSRENANALPAKLSDLQPQYISDPKLFVCPTDGRPYIYVSGQKNTDPPSYITVYEAPGAHKGEGLNVLFNDCSARWVTLRPEVEQQLELQRQALKAKGRELKLIEQP